MEFSLCSEESSSFFTTYMVQDKAHFTELLRLNTPHKIWETGILYKIWGLRKGLDDQGIVVQFQTGTKQNSHFEGGHVC
jgi:hypothetical protein